MGGSEQVERICRQQERCYGTYGYRRVWLWLEQQNIHHNPKTVLRIMKKYNLLAQIRRRRKWKQMGEQRHSAQYSFSYIGAFFVRTIWGSTFAAEILAKKPDIFWKAIANNFTYLFQICLIYLKAMVYHAEELFAERSIAWECGKTQEQRIEPLQRLQPKPPSSRLIFWKKGWATFFAVSCVGTDTWLWQGQRRIMAVYP